MSPDEQDKARAEFFEAMLMNARESAFMRGFDLGIWIGGGLVFLGTLFVEWMMR